LVMICSTYTLALEMGFSNAVNVVNAEIASLESSGCCKIVPGKERDCRREEPSRSETESTRTYRWTLLQRALCAVVPSIILCVKK
jgi:hypothetical protein